MQIVFILWSWITKWWLLQEGLTRWQGQFLSMCFYMHESLSCVLIEKKLNTVAAHYALVLSMDLKKFLGASGRASNNRLGLNVISLHIANSPKTWNNTHGQIEPIDKNRKSISAAEYYLCFSVIQRVTFKLMLWVSFICLFGICD